MKQIKNSSPHHLDSSAPESLRQRQMEFPAPWPRSTGLSAWRLAVGRWASLGTSVGSHSSFWNKQQPTWPPRLLWVTYILWLWIKKLTYQFFQNTFHGLLPRNFLYYKDHIQGQINVLIYLFFSTMFLEFLLCMACCQIGRHTGNSDCVS